MKPDIPIVTLTGAVGAQMTGMASVAGDLPGGIFTACIIGSAVSVYLRWRAKQLAGWGELGASLIIGAIAGLYLYPGLLTLLGWDASGAGTAAFIASLAGSQVVDLAVDAKPHLQRLLDAVTRDKNTK